MESLETELERARTLDTSALADAIETIGFECTRCGACCKGYEPDGDSAETEGVDAEREPHTATVFPDEVRDLQAAGDYDWRDVARPMPYGLTDGEDGPEGETFEWALQTDDCGDCTFYEESDDGTGRCGVHDDRPLICQTYPFSVGLGGTSQPMGETVDSVALPPRDEDGEASDTDSVLRAHECEGLGRDISRAEAEELAGALKQRAIREIREAIGVRDSYRPVDRDGVVVYDSEGPKQTDGRPLD